MSGLERLRELIQEHWPLPEWRDKSEFADELREIADEIELDMRIASAQMWTQIEGKPVLDDDEEFTHWLDRWYLTRPVIDGEPVQFGDEIECKCDGKTVPKPVSGFYIFENKPDRLYVNSEYVTYTPCVEDAKRFTHDSIEKLRIDMCNFNGCGSGAYIEFEACRDCNVTEWLSRAENLFGGGE